MTVGTAFPLLVCLLDVAERESTPTVFMSSRGCNGPPRYGGMGATGTLGALGRVDIASWEVVLGSCEVIEIVSLVHRLQPLRQAVDLGSPFHCTYGPTTLATMLTLVPKVLHGGQATVSHFSGNDQLLVYCALCSALCCCQ